MLSNIFNITLLALGFGFVIFWHELGHFLAAKGVGIKVEQFAVGFGHALLAWRKGIGLRVGTTQKEYERRINEYVESRQRGQTGSAERAEASWDQTARAVKELKLGETEYRLNWIPLGGYVKMLGQDDLKPEAGPLSDPRAYPNATVGARMLVISAGVIMNIILAAIGFMVLFSIGFRSPPPIVGHIVPGSPAQNVIKVVDGKPQKTSLRVGDEVLTLDGKTQHDWTKIALNVALLKPGETVDVRVRHVDGGEETYQITPARPADQPHGFVTLGIGDGPPRELRGLPKEFKVNYRPEFALADTIAVRPGDVVTHVNGQPVGVHEYYKFDRAVQESNGKPVDLWGTDKDGKTWAMSVQPYFDRPFASDTVDFAGMVPRTMVSSVMEESPALGKLMPGDVIVQVTSVDRKAHPTREELTDYLNKAGQEGRTVDLVVLRGGNEVTVAGLTPNVTVGADRKGLGLVLEADGANAVVGATAKDSPARMADIPKGATIVSVGGKPVANWFDARRELTAARAGEAVPVTYRVDGREKTAELKLTEAQLADLRSIRYHTYVTFHEWVRPRIANGPGQAAYWGVTETRDLILQFYVTLRRMFGGSVSYKNLMGPVGIFQSGAAIAFKGKDWLLWFLAMISANLAVVNFLPIPILDGGHFVFLLLEKVRGRPPSARTQSIAQVVGLALLLGVFLLVTYQDISRLISPGM